MLQRWSRWLENEKQYYVCDINYCLNEKTLYPSIFVIRIFSNTRLSYASFLLTFHDNSLRLAKTNACSGIARARVCRGAHARPRDAAFQISRLADGNAFLKCRDGVFSSTTPAATVAICCRILTSIYRAGSRSRISRMFARNSAGSDSRNRTWMTARGWASEFRAMMMIEMEYIDVDSRPRSEKWRRTSCFLIADPRQWTGPKTVSWSNIGSVSSLEDERCATDPRRGFRH